VEDGSECVEGGGHRIWSQISQPFYKPAFVDGANLVKKNQPVLSRMKCGNTIRRSTISGAHRGDQDSPKMIVHFRRRYQDARAGLLDFGADGRVEVS